MNAFSPDLLSVAFLAASSQDIGDLAVKIATAVGIIGGAVVGWRLKSRNADESELKTLRSDNAELRADVLALLGYTYSIRTSAAQQGLTLPEPPHLKSQDKDDDS